MSPATGHGKTQLLQQLILNDLSQPEPDVPGMVIIDSHGAMIKAVQDLEIFNLTKGSKLGQRVLIIDPSDIDFTPELNLFSHNKLEHLRPETQAYEEHINATAQTFTFIFSGLMGSELSPPQTTAFSYLAELMVFIPGATIHTLLEVLGDPGQFIEFIERLPNPVSRDYFLNTFSSKKFLATTGEAIRNRLLAVLRNRSFQRMFGAEQNRLDLFDFLNEGGILLVNTNRKFLGDDVSAIFGRYMIAMTFQAIMRRANIDQKDRRSAYLYIDEAHEYYDQTFNNLLTQARQYRLGVILAQQNLNQIPNGLEAAILGSTSIKFTGGLRIEGDRKILASEMNCQPSFIQSCLKDDHKPPCFSDFALHVANHTPQPIKYRVEFGKLNNQAKMSGDDFQALLDISRFKLTGKYRQDDDDGSSNSTPPPSTSGHTAPGTASQPPGDSVPKDIDDDVYHDIAGDFWQT